MTPIATVTPIAPTQFFGQQEQDATPAPSSDIVYDDAVTIVWDDAVTVVYAR